MSNRDNDTMETRLDVTRAEIVRLTGERDAAVATLRAVEALVALWLSQQETWSQDDFYAAGASAAVRLCARELTAALSSDAAPGTYR